MKLITFLTLLITLQTGVLASQAKISQPFGIKADSRIENGKIQFLGSFGVPDRHTSLLKIINTKKQTDSLFHFLGENIELGGLSVQYSGNRRGLDIFQIYSSDSLDNDFSIILNYGSGNYSSKANPDKDLELFTDLVNFEDVKYIQRNDILKSNKNTPKLQSANWYDPSKNYLLLETSRDGIATVNTDDILRYLPDINGKNADHLILYWNGQPYPYYFSSQSGIIGNGIDIYFYGRRGMGDTTYYSHYDPNSEFYFVYDENQTAVKLSLMGSPNSDLQINTVNYNKHLERDVYYSFGTDFILNLTSSLVQESNNWDSRTVMGEGWFWDVIDPKNKNVPVRDTFKINQFLALPDDPSGDLTLLLHYHGIQDSIKSNDYGIPDVPTFYRLNLEWNSIFADSAFFKGYTGGDLKININKNNSLNGLNEIFLRSLEFDSITAKSSCGIDYLILSGKAKPWAKNGFEEFGTDASSSPDYIIIPGFSDSKIFALDTIEQSFKTITGTKGFSYLIGAINDTVGTVSVAIDDSVFYSAARGLFIIKKSGVNFEAKYFADGGHDALNYLNSIENGAIVGVMINNSITASQDFKNALKSLGAAANFSSSDSWVFCTIKGTSLHDEKTTTGESANISGFFENQSGSSFKARLDLDAANGRYIYLNDGNSIDKAKVSPVGTSNLRSTDNQADAIFIYNSLIKKSCTDYVNYRSTKTDKKIIMVDVADIYKEFAFGKKSPHSIKEFLKYAISSWQKPAFTHVVLFGDANEYPNGNVDGTVSKNLIPSFGNPVSDFWYSQLNGDDDFQPDFVVGRIPIDNDDDGEIYLHNMSAFEANKDETWLKNYLIMVGGNNSVEVNLFYNYFYNFEDILEPKPFCANMVSVKKSSFTTGSINQAGEIRQKINAGDLFTTYIGHASSEIFDMDGWEVDYLNNKNRTGILLTVSCNTGAFAVFNLEKCRNEKYILTKDKGFIIALGSSTTGFLQDQIALTKNMFMSIADTKLKLHNIGDAVYYGKNKISNYYTSLYTKQQFTILGDPLYNLPIPKNSDLFFSKNDLKIASDKGSNILTVDDNKLIISGKIYNNGYCACNPLRLRLIRTYKSKSDTLFKGFASICKLDSFSFELPIINMGGSHEISLTIDPDESITDDNRENNTYSTRINVLAKTLLPVEPLEYCDVNAADPKFRVINPFENQSDLIYFFKITDKSDNVIITDSSNQSDTKIIIQNNYIDWLPRISLENGANYSLIAKYFDKNTGAFSTDLTIPFTAMTDGMSYRRAIWKLSDSLELSQMKLDGTFIENHDGKPYLTPIKKDFNYDLFGLMGHDSVWSYASITVGDEVFVSERYKIGFSVAVLKSDLDNDSSSYHNYETNGLSIAEWDWVNSNESIKLVNFLKDSIQDDDYVFVITSQPSFRIPVLYQYNANTDYLRRGSMDSLKDAMTALGSNVFDTLQLSATDAGYMANFAQRGWKGINNEDIRENWNYDRDTAQIVGSITRYKKYSGFTTPLIGPSVRWNELALDGQLDNDNVSTIITIYGVGKFGDTTAVQMDTNTLSVDLHGISAETYPYIFLKFEFERKSMSIAKIRAEKFTGISSMQVDYSPGPEIIINKTRTKPLQDSVMRGNTANLMLTAENISLRTPAENLKAFLTFNSGGVISYDTAAITTIEPNTSNTQVYAFETDELDNNSQINVEFNKDHSPAELYYFNNSNSFLFHLINDTEPPSTELYSDSIFVRNNDYISKTPRIEVRIFDNSLIPITDSTKIQVRLNGMIYPYDWKQNKCEFISYGKNQGLKAIFRFSPDTLIYEDNLFIVYAIDAAGNHDTTETYARVSLLNAFVDTLSTYPNPAAESVNLAFYFRSRTNSGKSLINIYDITGNIVATIGSKINIGWNVVNFPLKNTDGNSLSSGVYYYRLSIEDNLYVDPKFGKFIIAN